MLNDLRRAEPPAADDARRRAWAVTAQAFAARPRRLGRVRAIYRPQVGPAVRLGLALVVIAVVGAFAFTPPGDAVADWFKRVVDPPPARPVERPVTAPGPGRMLVAGERSLRIVGRTGAGVSLGRWSGGTWSPNGRFVGAWRDRELAALAPDGVRRWTLRTAAPIAAARWSPEGFHVAYLLTGGELRVVAGNGLRDRLWRANVAPVTPAFRPNARRTLAWVRRDGRIPVTDLFTGELRARSGPRLGRDATAIAWSGDGRRLAVLTRDHVRVWNVRRNTVRTIALDGRGEALAASPRGNRVAVLTHDERRDVSAVTVLGTGSSVRVRGTLRDLTFSPDGRTLLAAWPANRRWLVLGAGGETLAPDPTARSTRGRITSWCCPRTLE